MAFKSPISNISYAHVPFLIPPFLFQCHIPLPTFFMSHYYCTISNSQFSINWSPYPTPKSLLINLNISRPIPKFPDSISHAKFRKTHIHIPSPILHLPISIFHQKLHLPISISHAHVSIYKSLFPTPNLTFTNLQTSRPILNWHLSILISH